MYAGVPMTAALTRESPVRAGELGFVVYPFTNASKHGLAPYSVGMTVVTALTKKSDAAAVGDGTANVFPADDLPANTSSEEDAVAVLGTAYDFPEVGHMAIERADTGRYFRREIAVLPVDGADSFESAVANAAALLLARKKNIPQISSMFVLLVYYYDDHGFVADIWKPINVYVELITQFSLVDRTIRPSLDGYGVTFIGPKSDLKTWLRGVVTRISDWMERTFPTIGQRICVWCAQPAVSQFINSEVACCSAQCSKAHVHSARHFGH